MHEAVFVVPGSIDTRTGGSIYDRRMVDGLRHRGWTVEVRELDTGFPFPRPAAIAHAAEVLAAVATNTVVVIDGLALSVLPDLIEREASRLRIAALIHLPVSAAVGLDLDTAERLAAVERRALHAAAMIVVTGRTSLAMLQRYALAPKPIVVVEPGTDRAVPVQRSEGSTLMLLSVATLNPGKGHDVLLQALARVPHRGWHLTCVGSLTRHPETTTRVRHLIRELDLADCVSLTGELDRAAVADYYYNSDVFVLATRQETYGMAVAEALAHGHPVVSTMTGAIPQLVGREAGVLVPPGDVDALAEALSRVIGDAAFRARLAGGARRVSAQLPGWNDAAARFAAALEGLGTNG
ncbi:MAG: glycosyltransferase family 4 protein [Vicinamibacterales bacterium]